MTYINDSNSQSELVRLTHQARLVTATTGLLPALLEDTDFTSALDVGCGTGQWAIDLACMRQDVKVTAIDISHNMISYAITRAGPHRLDNISFEALDIFQKKLPFAEGSFDLIHLRFGVSWVQGYTNWLLLFARLYVLLKPGGYVVITEGENIYTNSLALERLHEIFCAALHKSGYSLSSSPRFIGVVPRLGYLLSQSGFQSIGSEASVLDYSYYNKEANMQWRTSFHLLVSEAGPFLLSAGTNAEELAKLDFQISLDMYQEDFCGIGPIFSFYARK
jgi:ubiquinone/menaquinone biosynthesis C-methylase UbiE